MLALLGAFIHSLLRMFMLALNRPTPVEKPLSPPPYADLVPSPLTPTYEEALAHPAPNPFRPPSYTAELADTARYEVSADAV